jgi:5-methylcytosine-specific restriction enzyme subunit McrC
MLLYPERPGLGCAGRAQFGVAGGSERLRVATVDLSADELEVVRALKVLVTTSVATIPSLLPWAAG